MVDVPDHVGSGLVPHAIQVRQLLDREIVQVRHAFDKPAVHQLVDQRVPQAVDVHHAPRGKMPDRFLQSSRAVDIDASAGRFAFFPHHAAPAYGAYFRDAEDPPVSTLHLDPNHFRNHIAASFHHHRIADLQSKPRDLVFVMQRGPRYRHAADGFWRQMRHRRESACAPHLHGNVDDLRLDLPCRVLECNGPARRFRGEPEPPLLRYAVHLKHHAVDLVR